VTAIPVLKPFPSIDIQKHSFLALLSALCFRPDLSKSDQTIPPPPAVVHDKVVVVVVVGGGGGVVVAAALVLTMEVISMSDTWCLKRFALGEFFAATIVRLPYTTTMDDEGEPPDGAAALPSKTWKRPQPVKSTNIPRHPNPRQICVAVHRRWSCKCPAASAEELSPHKARANSRDETHPNRAGEEKVYTNKLE
jgi:hypothetical protein